MISDQFSERFSFVTFQEGIIFGNSHSYFFQGADLRIPLPDWVWSLPALLDTGQGGR
jgi:hypothetical protein